MGVKVLVCEVATDDLIAQINRTETGHFRVTWSDYVANEWAESYETLPVALVRLAWLVGL
jgi:hypothetical protein